MTAKTKKAKKRQSRRKVDPISGCGSCVGGIVLMNGTEIHACDDCAHTRAPQGNFGVVEGGITSADDDLAAKVVWAVYVGAVEIGRSRRRPKVIGAVTTNSERADWANAALEAYVRGRVTDEDPQTNIKDLIGDLCHLMEAETGLKPGSVANVALSGVEIREEEREDPP